MKLVNQTLHLMYVILADLTANGLWKSVGFYTQKRGILTGLKRDDKVEDVGKMLADNQSVYYVGIDKTQSIPNHEIEDMERNDIIAVILHETIEDGHSLWLDPEGNLYETTELGKDDPDKKLILTVLHIKMLKCGQKLFRELRQKNENIIIGYVTHLETNTITIHLDEYCSETIKALPENHEGYIVKHKVITSR